MYICNAFLNLVLNISESCFEGYPVRRHDCTYQSAYGSVFFSAVSPLPRGWVDPSYSPFYHHFTTILPPFYHHFTTISPPFYHHFTTTLPPFYHHFTTILQPFYHHFTTIFPPFYNHFTTILYTILPPILPPFYNNFTTILPPLS